MLAAVARPLLGRVAFASSLGAEDQVLTDMMAAAPRIPIFTLDTGRLPQETYDLIDDREALRHPNRGCFPTAADVEALVDRDGVNLFYDSVEARRCCHVRKVLPLRRELLELDAWITGLRREQAATRQNVAVAEWDEPPT